MNSCQLHARQRADVKAPSWHTALWGTQFTCVCHALVLVVTTALVLVTTAFIGSGWVIHRDCFVASAMQHREHSVSGGGP